MGSTTVGKSEFFFSEQDSDIVIYLFIYLFVCLFIDLLIFPFINYLLTDSEVFTGKSQTDALHY